MKKIQTIRFQDSEFYFHNCPICEGMRHAEDEDRELGAIELKRLFKKLPKNKSI